MFSSICSSALFERGIPFITVAVVALLGCDPLGEHYRQKAKDEPVPDVEIVEEDAIERDAASCAACHAPIVEEWKRSMHSRSTADRDPLFAAMLKRASEKMGPETAAERCSQCHYAEWSKAAEAKNRDPVGVTCLVCHQIAPKHPRERLSNGEQATLARSHGDVTGAQGLCLSCHAELNTADGRPICITGLEAESVKAGRCVDCHMGPAQGRGTSAKIGQTEHRSHDFIGSRSQRFLAGAARISLTRAQSELIAKVEFGRAGHRVPTGNPMRFLVARIDQLDAKGRVIASNIDAKESPPLSSGAVFMRIFSDAKGNRPVPPFASTGEPEDTRLSPGEKREIRVPVSPKAAAARARLEYHLAPAGLLREAGLPIEPTVMNEASLSLE